MKKRTIPLFIFIVVIATACSPAPLDIPTELATEPAEEKPVESPVVLPTDTPTESATDQPGESRVSYAQSDVGRDLEPQLGEQVLESLSRGNNAFAFDFYKQAVGSNQNLVFSPLSLSLALSMTAAGADSITRQEMLQVLNLESLGEDIHPAFNALLLGLEESQKAAPDDSAGDEFQLNIANSTWAQAGADFESAYLDTLARNYGAGIYSADYENAPEAARQAINDWVAKETEQKIEDLIPQGAIDTMTRIVLANAIYFNGSWLHPFEVDDTTDAPFTLIDGSQMTVEMMHLPQEQLQYLRGENYQIVRLPYLSADFSMLVLVPDQGLFEVVENQVDADWLDDALSNISGVPVDLKMPKFDFESTVDASTPLKELGMKTPFDPEMADFSGISQVLDLFISDVLHKATITVDELGTEAAAATAVIMGVTSAPVEGPISLVIDRPFVYLIHHHPTNAILFLGRVMAP